MAGERVYYKSTHPAEGEASGILFGEPKSGSKAIVLIHEWWGINGNTLDMARKIHEAGFVVLAADIFRGKVYTEVGPARENMLAFDHVTGARDILAAVEYLKQTGCSKVGVFGFSFGAILALVSAAVLADRDVIDAVAALTGVPKSEVADLTKITCPVQGHFAAKDKIKGVSSPDDYNNLAMILTDGNVDLEMCIYDAGHAFPNPEYDTYNPEETKKFYDNLFRFYHQNLAS